MSDMDDIIREFLVESNEGLDQMDRDLVELEKDPDSRELLARIFRAIHTIKGTSGVLGFPKLESVAHVGENLLSRMRDGKMRLTPRITTALLAMVDLLRAILGAIEDTGAEGERDCAEVISLLNALLADENHAPIIQATSAPAASSTTLESLIPSGTVKQGKPQSESGEAAKLPQPAKVLADANCEGGPEASRQPESRSVAASGNVRVDVGLLDKMMNLVGELVLARNQVLQHTALQKNGALISAAQRLNLITTELQEAVMKTRMQPIGNVWNKFPRLVRDLALNCGKEVRIQLEGSETELDKTIIEAIKDPLMHIVRNSVDHGIEAPDVRQLRGKSAEGELVLRAFHKGGQVNIEISDDGSGIDVVKVKEKAITRGLVQPDRVARMNDRELVGLIFLPGFSTAEKVTNVSGRGVGMDVVKTNIEKIGGTVDVQSTGGQGTTIRIKIPLTLAIIPALIVTSGGERFAIPQIGLVELVRLEAEQAETAIEYVHGAPVYRLRGNLLPLLYLNHELRLATVKSTDAINIVVLQADGRQFGLIVDAINDTEEIVVKPLGKHLKGLSAFAGTTIMGDGHVALILDVLGIAHHADVLSESQDTTHLDSLASTSADANASEKWLVFKAGDKALMAVPLSRVARLEEINRAQVETAEGREVVQYRGEIMPLLRVTALLGQLSAAQECDPVQVIVFTHAGRSVGLVVDEIVDVAEEQVAVTKASSRSGLLGSAVIHERVTDLIDVPTLIKSELGDTSVGATGMGA